MKKLVFLFLLLAFSKLNAQQVYCPVESWLNDELYKSNVQAFYKLRYDKALNQFNQINYQLPDSVDSYIQIASNYPKFNKPIFNTFYKDGKNFYKLEKQDDYLLIINPILHFVSGQDDSGSIWQNTRGLEIKGNIGGMSKGVGFYSMLTENQALLPYPYRYFTDSLNFVPNEFFYKKFKNKGAIDFFQARAYFTFNAVNNHIRFQFGHDKNKIGNGYRSLILSEYAPQYLFLKINTDVGRFHYQNLFTQFTDNGPILSNILYGKKYGAFHRLSFDLRPNLNIGLNEMVIFDRIDSTQLNQFDLNYLNPVIFYRAIESNLGSRDNSMMAADINWDIKKRYVLYGQFVLDEFNLKYIKSQPNWWANKYAYQIGAKILDAFKIKSLDAFVEYNRCRPYTYSHMRPTQSFTHFNQALAHPLGSNFSETVLGIRYNYKSRWYANLVFTNAVAGRDSFLNGRNYGSNLLRSYNTRVTDFDSKMFMGKKVHLSTLDLSISYMIKYNLFIDARLNLRQLDDSKNLFFSLGFRMNTNLKKFDY